MPDVAAARLAALTIRKFDRALHDRSAFSCGHGPIDHFLKSSLSDQIRTRMVAAYMTTEGGDPAVLGFYTLGAMAVRADLGSGAWARARVSDVPAIYIRAVAVRKDRQGEGLGAALVIDALRKCREIAYLLGAAAVVLDVMRDNHFERRRAFYERLGFFSLDDPDNRDRVYVSMKDLRATLGDHSSEK